MPDVTAAASLPPPTSGVNMLQISRRHEAEASSSSARITNSQTRLAPPSASSFASRSFLKRKVVSSNDDSLTTRMQPKLTSSSWRRVKSHQHVGLNGPTRRTVLEWLPREVVFIILGMLAFHDIQSLLKADRRIRPFVHLPGFATWRKRLASLMHKERLYDESIAAQQEAMFATETNDDQPEASHLVPQQRQRTKDTTCSKDEHDVEATFLNEYSDALRALHLKTAPLDLTGLLPCVTKVWHQHRAFSNLRKWCRDFELGRSSAHSLFSEVDDTSAIEFFSFLRVYLLVIRISRAFAEACPPLQIVRCLDYDCRSATLSYFAPRLSYKADVNTFSLTEEQARFVECDVRPGEMVKVQAFAGTGKTRSLLAYAEKRLTKRFLYIAFNVSAANSAKARFPSNVDCRTMHSVALRQVVLVAGQDIGDLRARDVVRILGDRLPEGQLTRTQASSTQLGRDNKITSTAVATYILTTLQRFFYSDDPTITPEKHVPAKVTSDTDLKVRSIARCAEELWDLIREGGADRTGKPVRCPHDGYVKLLQLQAPHHSERYFKAFDVLLLDEAQDLSAAQVSILLRARKSCGILVVGDVFQKIYGFRGGTARAFNERLYPSTANFQLTKSFRFGNTIAKIATEMLALRKPAPWEKVSTKPVLSGAAGGSDRLFAEASLLLRREREENAPGDDTATPHASNVATQQEGRQAIALEVSSVSAVGKSDDIFVHTRIFRSNRKLCLTALALSASLPQPHRMYLKTSQALQPDSIVQLLRDAHILYHNDSRSMSRNSLLRDFASWKDLVQRVEAEGGGESKLSLAVALGNLFASSDFLDQVAILETRFCRSEAEATVVLTTVHQAKGLEWDCVLVEDDFRPVYGSERSQRLEVVGLWQQDELNHLYVALTRAKRHLIVSKPVLEWVTAMRGLCRYSLTVKNGACKLCQTSKQPIVVREYRLPVFDFLNPRCNEAVLSSASSETAAVGSVNPNTITPMRDAEGCLSCLAAQGDAVGDADLIQFVSSAAKIAKQRPVVPKSVQESALSLPRASSTSLLVPSAANPNSDFKLDPSKHPFLRSDHRAMKWAVMHHEYKRAVDTWLQ